MSYRKKKIVDSRKPVFFNRVGVDPDEDLKTEVATQAS